jgi:hypothetical protein
MMKNAYSKCPATPERLPLRGLAHANRLRKIVTMHEREPLTRDPIVDLNSAILASYRAHAREDEASPTGYSYPDGVDDETIRAHAAHITGHPIALFQVVAVRRFMNSLFFKGMTVNDVIRIRRMFAGAAAREACMHGVTVLTGRL